MTVTQCRTENWVGHDKIRVSWGRATHDAAFLSRCQFFLGIAMLVASSLSANAQDMFNVKNLKKQKWPQEEANRIYLVAVEGVAREFKLTLPVPPQFTLVLGYKGNELDVNSRELRLEKWDRRLFADGVIPFPVEQMLTEEMRSQLLRRTLLAVDSTIAVEPDRASRRRSAAPTKSTSASVHASPAQTNRNTQP